MADGLIRGQRTEDGRQRSCAASPRLFARATAFCLLSSVLCPLAAEELPDPTRPPDIFAAPGTPAGQPASESRPSGLQSTIISKSRRAAIIDGKNVELGAKHGNARLIEVNEGSVVLQGAKTRQVLTLFPDVKMYQRETRTRKALPESEVQPEKISTMPDEQHEKTLSGHQKEKK